MPPPTPYVCKSFVKSSQSIVDISSSSKSDINFTAHTAHETLDTDFPLMSKPEADMQNYSASAPEMSCEAKHNKSEPQQTFLASHLDVPSTEFLKPAENTNSS